MLPDTRSLTSMIKMSEVTRVWNPIIHDVMFSIIEHEIRVINMSTMLATPPPWLLFSHIIRVLITSVEVQSTGETETQCLNQKILELFLSVRTKQIQIGKSLILNFGF